MLASSYGQTGTMTDVANNSDSVVVEPVDEATTLILNFYASKMQFQSKNALITARAFVKGGISPVRVNTSVFLVGCVV